MHRLLVKYITKQATESEYLEVKAWIRESEENKLVYIQMYEAWHESLVANKEVVNADAAYDLFLNNIKRSKAEY
ncbi:hypothetical protein [Pedobacter sp. SYSU D00535]|uniref:hypothetical protein n=1 Tax=Pedobacter sp. SYSU D00535 TaxID=2810308 RepID=UPI001A959F68|nr:hypothetical protein [Pedobacter sp. SYSU D00535]